MTLFELQEMETEANYRSPKGGGLMADMDGVEWMVPELGERVVNYILEKEVVDGWDALLWLQYENDQLI